MASCSVTAPNRDPRFVYASSSSVYGDRLDAPFRETDSVDLPISPYAATKKACEPARIPLSTICTRDTNHRLAVLHRLWTKKSP